jgi:ATP-binding cassette subfamily B protein
LTLVFLAALPVYGWLLRYSSRRLKPIFESLEDGMGKYRSRQLDSIRGIETVKAMAVERALERDMVEQFSELACRVFRADFTMMLYQAAIQLVTFASLALFLWIGALEVLYHHLSTGGFVAFSSLVVLANTPILVLLGAWDNAQYSQVIIGRLDDIIGEPPEQGEDHSQLRHVPSLQGNVSLQQLRGRGRTTPKFFGVMWKEIPGRGRTVRRGR